MSGELCVSNRQRARPVDLRLLKRLIRDLLANLLLVETYDLTVHLVNEREMTQLNESILRHAGSTDVITLDYSEPGGPLAGEIYICVNEALVQAARFRTTWQAEMARYLVHGLLHLRGYNDLRPAERRRMKREENRLLAQLSRRFDLRKLERRPKLAT
jgi:probable rRNA maturation factor